MSTEIIESDLEFTCDECGESEAFDQEIPFRESWEMLKSDGWRAFQKDGDWQHRCPDCVGK